ncbi:hypothetical protein RQP46_001685 [Phenoliferia psychrophenolica]
MRATRSTTAPVVAATKRAASPVSTPRKRVKKEAPEPAPAPASPAPSDGAEAGHSVKEGTEADKGVTVLLHPALTFEFADAKAHLTSVDPRWGTLMSQLKCKPFDGEQTAPFAPFRLLITTQQVSWLAARSITHKFVRLFYPHLPEKLAKPASAAPGAHEGEVKESEESPFPTPAQILALPNMTPTLRSAGLSGRKVEYIIELAERFHDGRLDAKKLWDMEDDEVRKTLLEVRGIGIWTVQMFLIFSMKRPDVLPVGDLGIQKNLCKWYSADPSLVPAIHPRKLERAATPPPVVATKAEETPSTPVQSTSAAVAYPTPSTPSILALKADDVPAPVPKLAVPPPARQMVFPTTSNNLTAAAMKARLNKKLKGNIYLNPLEMEELTIEWAPYRSVACWYLWSITDGTGDP